MDLEHIPLRDLLAQDTKKYNLFEKDITIAQVMRRPDSYAKEHIDEIRQELKNLRKETETISKWCFYKRNPGTEVNCLCGRCSAARIPRI